MVELDCNATGDPTPVITWQRFGNHPLPIGQITNAGSFVIKNVTVNDEGSYVCIANNIAGSANSATSLTVIVPPVIVLPSSEISIMEGQAIELDCQSTGKPQPTIKWMKGNQPVPIASEGFTDQLLRFTVTGNDTGIYSCLATNIGGSDLKNVSITVLVPPRIINGEEETIQVIENTDTSLNCDASGYPPPVISWNWKESEHITIPDTSEHRSVDGNSLLIKNASVDLSGVYVCDAENLAGIAQKIFNLEVLVMPKILDTFPSVINLTVGDDFPLSCKASGHPTPTVFWQKENVVLRPGHQLGNLVVMQDHTLVLWNATLESSGTYSCNAYNPAGVASRNHTFNVIAAPTLMDSNVTRVEVQETHNGLLTCPITSADSPSSIVWLKDGQPVDFRANERADDVHFLAAENSRTLNIVEARASDGGVYTCIAQNPAGTTQAKFTVDITAPPYFVNEYPELNFVVNQGESVTFDCVVAGNPPPKVNWHNLEKNLPVTSHTTPGAVLDSSKQKLIIGSAKHHHNGKYRCSVFNTLDNLQRTFKLTVIGSPEIEGSAEETIELIIGESYNLVCSITGTPLPTYSWYFNGTKSGRKISDNTNLDLLKLTNVTMSNNGTFTCMANNTAGSQIKRFNVIVRGPPKIEDSDFIEDVRVKSNEFLRLSCVVSGAPEPTITWLRNGVITKGLIIDKQPEVINNTYSITLQALSGKYSCMASNKAGVAEKQFNVKVLVAPQWAKQKEYFSNDNQQLVEGQPLTIKCPVTGNPPPDIYWFLNGVPINGSEVDKDTIHFDNTNSERSGNYTCLAVNHAGNFSKSFKVDILVPPTFLEKDEIIDFRVPTNTTVKFNCSVNGSPVPQILWLRGFATLPWKNSSQILEMESVSVEDSGEYSCLASNLAGDAEKTFRLQVLEPPAMDEETTTPVSNLTVKLHRRVAIKCPLNGAPLPKITWYKDGKVITSDAKNMVEISQDERQLQIMQAVAEDAGSYRCVAENQVGIKELLFDLTVVVPLEWSEWANWGPCSVSCGGGGQERKRYCGGNSNSSKEITDSVSSPLVVLDKSNCLGDSMQHRKCNIAPCQMDDGWTDWSNWSSCSATCGESQKQRVRDCRTTRPALDGLPCIGPAIEFESCQVPDCTYWGDWSEWSDCSATCGYGTKFRERKCLKSDGVCDGQYREVISCNVHRCPIDGSWSSWGQWSSCSVSCGRGIRRRVRMCIQPKYGGKRCDGDNLEIEKCRLAKCHKDIPRRANLAIRGELNGEKIKPTKVSAEIKKYRGKRVVTASVDDMLKQQAGWFPYLTFLMPPVTWNVAEEEGSSNNGYSLTDGNFEQESKFQFATGHELFVDSKGQGINPKSGALEVDIEVIGEIPLAQPKSTVFIEPFTEDFVQTDKNKLFASSNSTIDVDGELVPYQWNKTVMYDTELGTMPYLVERLSTDQIETEYDSRNHKVHYSAATSISSPYSQDTCPKGFVVDERYQHCKDIDECKNKSHKCHKTQICENLFGSYKCHCQSGFKSAGQGKRCTDINECDLHRDKCSHYCTNTRGSYKCSCPDGMSLGSDQKTCFDEYGSDQDYSAYPDSYTADDWGGGHSMNNNYRPENSGYNQNYYDDPTPQRRSKSSDYDRFQEFEKPAESWACPPGHIKEGNKCVDTQTKGHCNTDRCSEYEICLPTYNGHRCVQTPCPVNYHRDYRTRKCIQFCNEGVCVNGATNSEEIMFVPLPLEITSVQRYQDLLELSVQGDPNGVIFTITENYGNLPLRVRIENGHGVLYSLKFFDIENIQKVVVVATTYDADHETPLFINSFEIFLYDPSAF